jgi:hypothetical protein
VGDSAAHSRFVEYERQTTDWINASTSNVHAELWNRAYVKALKLASLLAVGINLHQPTITIDLADYAIDLVNRQTAWLTSKFENGEVGAEEGNQAKQRNHIIRLIHNYMTGPADKLTKSQGILFNVDEDTRRTIILKS